MREYPSLGEPAQGSEEVCMARLATAHAHLLGHYRTRRDIYAIFATSAYLATCYQRDVAVMLLENRSRRQESALFSRDRFDPMQRKEDAFAFYAAMFELLGTRRATNEYITFKIATLPSTGPS